MAAYTDGQYNTNKTHKWSVAAGKFVPRAQWQAVTPEQLAAVEAQQKAAAEQQAAAAEQKQKQPATQPQRPATAGAMATFVKQQVGGTDTAAAAGLREQAVQHEKQAAQQQKTAQRGFQIANRDARVEGDKDASTRAASQYGQKMAQISGAAGGGAAALASMNVQDPSADIKEHRARGDQQLQVGQQIQDLGEANKQEAIYERTAARQDQEEAAVVAQRLDEGEQLSNPPEETDPKPDVPEPTPPTVEPPAPEQPAPAPGQPPATPEEARVGNALSDPGLKNSPKYEQWRQEGLAAHKAGDAAWAQWATKMSADPEFKAAGGTTIGKSRVKSETGAGGAGAQYSSDEAGNNIQTRADGSKVIFKDGAWQPYVPSDGRLKHIVKAVNRRFI